MKLCIHRGANQIGGNCIEFEQDGQRIILDLGLPLDAEPTEELMPAVEGFRVPSSSLLGVFISHPHIDHYGLAPYLPKEVPLFMGEKAGAIIRAASHFMKSGWEVPLFTALKHKVPISLGPFEVIPYLVDHSAYDSYAFLVCAGGKRVFYSGDLRSHGRKGRFTEDLINNPPPKIDALILEGTSVGRADPDEKFTTESELEKIFASDMKATKGMYLVMASAQNVDRVVTVYRACKRASRQLVVDLYAAEILRATGNNNIPQGTWKNVRVFMPQFQRRLAKRDRMFDTVNRYRENRIFQESLADEAPNSTLLFRPSMIDDLNGAGCLKDAKLAWSMWEGYLRQAKMRPLLDWLLSQGISVVSIHTSGHASIKDLSVLAEAIKPVALIPIHTLGYSAFSNCIGIKSQ